MTSLKCTDCGLVYIDRGQPCTRCGTSNAADPRPPEEKRGGSRGALAAFVCLLLIVAGGGVYYLRPVPTPAYVEAIRASEQLRQLATVRVNQAPLELLPSGLESDKPGVTPAAYVLEARGLLAFDYETEETRLPGIENAQSTFRVGPNGSTYLDYSRGPDIVSTRRRLVIRLTPAGEREAQGWRETEEGYGGEPDVSFWRVPVGEAEFVRVEQVHDGPGEGGGRKLSAEVVWRWRPNWLGQSFDQGGQVFGLLPEEARAAARTLGLKSRGELKALAELEPTEDGRWRVLSITPLALYRSGGDFVKVD